VLLQGIVAYVLIHQDVIGLLAAIAKQSNNISVPGKAEYLHISNELGIASKLASLRSLAAMSSPLFSWPLYTCPKPPSPSKYSNQKLQIESPRMGI
jgi:hypothetical protein